jgi:FKBP-type peptidyl-prolyl cis-trans isomerase FkpA
VLPSGLIFTETVVGTGPAPGPTSRVRVHYHGTFPDGRVFDSSVDRGQPSTFPVNRVIKCWTEGLQLMRVGGKATLVCPPGIAYGERGRPPKIPASSTLHFDVELLSVQ